jgi:uncharacterized protein (DUF362 family)/Pyruvate/2-oxoacid:ferredoxin oxidoreductase delta subunit
LVSIEKCENYEYENVKKAVKKSIENIGGLEKYIKKGENVLLKANLILKKHPDDAATTHPQIVRVLAELLKEYGANVFIGDSPGGPFNLQLLKSLYKYTGMEKAAALSGASLCLDTSSSSVSNPDGEKLKKLTVTNMVLKADKVISVGKFKSHRMTSLTGAVKNMFGAIPGTTKAEYHFFCQNIDDFANSLIDICLYTKPVLSFLDAVYGMEGNGPTAGDKRYIGAIMASENPFELDLAMTKMAGAKPDDIPIVKESLRRNLCSFEKLKIIGNINNFIMDDFKIPKNKSLHFLGNNPPKFLNDFVKLHMNPRPVFNKSLCIGCGDCMRNCPAKIITMKNHRPKADLKKCIRCYCCQELCPKKAVSVKTPVILKLLSKM